MWIIPCPTSAFITCFPQPQSMHRPEQTLRVLEVEASRFQDISVHEGGKIVSPKNRPPLPPREYSMYTCLLEAESTQGPQCNHYINEKFQ